MSFGELYKVINGKHEKISIAAFNFHLKRLRKEENVIDKYDNPIRGTRVYYFLTENGKQKYQFYYHPVLSKDLLDEERRQNVYQLLFFFVSKYYDQDVIYRLDSEEKFENFLSKINMSKNMLEVVSTVHNDSGGMYPIDNKIYESKTTTEFKPIQGVKIWKDDHHDCTWFATSAPVRSLHVKHRKITCKKAYDQGRIVLKFTRRWDEGKGKARREEKAKIDDFSYYYYTLPIGGVSVLDVVDHREFVFEHAGFTTEEVRKAFDRLKEMDIIRPTKVLFGEIRYSFNPSHESLKELLREYWRIPGEVLAKMNRIWQYVRGPTSEEQKWLELFYGKNRSRETLIGYHDSRYAFKRVAKGGTSLGKMLKIFTDLSKEDREEIIHNTTREEKKKMIIDLQRELGIFLNDVEYDKQLISDFDKSIKKNMKELEEKYANIIQKYHFALKSLRDIIYPEYIQNATYNILNNKSR
ncbi:hypothetical protein BH18THE2_BH18THE2_22710 [soil metagenome]